MPRRRDRRASARRRVVLVARPGERLAVGVAVAVEQRAAAMRSAAPVGCAFSCPICASRRCLLERRPCPAGTPGCSTTSAKTSSDGPRFVGSACRRTNERSSELPVDDAARRGRRARRRSRTCRAWSCRRRSGRAPATARPAFAGRIGGVAGVDGERDVDERRRVPLEQHHLQAVRRASSRCTAGNVHVGRVAERRQDLAIDVGLARRRAADTACTDQRVVRRVEPRRCAVCAHVARASPWPCARGDRGTRRRWPSKVRLSARMSERPPKPPSRSMPRTKSASDAAAARAAARPRSGPAASELADHARPSRARRAPGSTPGFTRGDDDEQARRARGRRCTRDHGGGQLLVVDQPRDRGARCASRSARSATSSRCCSPASRHGGRVIDAVDARLRHAVLHLVADVARRAAAPTARRASSGGPGGMPSKYFFTSASARSGVMSPASESTQLFGP